MATFNIGQRVRVVSVMGSAENHLLGRVGTVRPLPKLGVWEYAVELDGVPPQKQYGVYGFDAHHLAPLTDPKAEEFIESLKRLGREPAPREEEAFAKVRKLLEQSE